MNRTQHIAYFKIPYKQKDNNNYRSNDNFCCGNKGENKGDGITDNEDPELNQFYYHSDHLGSSSYITNLKGSIVQHVEYVPFGEVFLEEKNNKWNTPYLFNGKELDEETGLYYYGARYYSSRNSIFLSVDPLWEAKPSFSPYNYCSWNPVMRVDPSGMTDFRFNKKTGEVTQVGKTNDAPDRIVRTNRHGEVKYKKNGKAKIAVDNIEKGILKNGQNFKNEDQIISVGGDRQPTLAGVEDFVTKIGEYVGVEIAGAYLSNKTGADANISKVYIDEYKGNKPKQSSISLTKIYTDKSLKGMHMITHFHTHPSNLGISRIDVERPSYADFKFRDDNKKYFNNFFILTKEANYPYNVMQIPYTNWIK